MANKHTNCQGCDPLKEINTWPHRPILTMLIAISILFATPFLGRGIPTPPRMIETNECDQFDNGIQDTIMDFRQMAITLDTIEDEFPGEILVGQQSLVLDDASDKYSELIDFSVMNKLCQSLEAKSAKKLKMSLEKIIKESAQLILNRPMFTIRLEKLELIDTMKFLHRVTGTKYKAPKKAEKIVRPKVEFADDLQFPFDD